MAFSADGELVASGSEDKTVKLWDAATGAEVRTLSGHSKVVHSVAFSADGGLVASGSMPSIPCMSHASSCQSFNNDVVQTEADRVSRCLRQKLERDLVGDDGGIAPEGRHWQRVPAASEQLVAVSVFPPAPHSRRPLLSHTSPTLAWSSPRMSRLPAHRSAPEPRRSRGRPRAPPASHLPSRSQTDSGTL